MTLEAIKKTVRSLTEIAAWPELLEIVERVDARDEAAVWNVPIAACRAVGGSQAAALPGAAAVFCSLLSIHLVDDMLDDEPRADFRRIGAGRAANIALALQAAGHLVLADRSLGDGVVAAAQRVLAWMSLGTAYGQGLDGREARSEQEYWEIVEAKTPPLFGAAFELGARLGGATPEVVARLEQVGRLLGRFIQVSDDLSDALKTPARTDWQRPRNNLPLLYALTAPHPDRERFQGLVARAHEPDALAEAHRILLRSGAVGYCALRMIEFARQARTLLHDAPLAAPEHTATLWRVHMAPLRKLLERIGVDAAGLAEIGVFD